MRGERLPFGLRCSRASSRLPAFSSRERRLLPALWLLPEGSSCRAGGSKQHQHPWAPHGLPFLDVSQRQLQAAGLSLELWDGWLVSVLPEIAPSLPTGACLRKRKCPASSDHHCLYSTCEPLRRKGPFPFLYLLMAS